VSSPDGERRMTMTSFPAGSGFRSTSLDGHPIVVAVLGQTN
jgi:hypothetical protein